MLLTKQGKPNLSAPYPTPQTKLHSGLVVETDFGDSEDSGENECVTDECNLVNGGVREQRW